MPPSSTPARIGRIAQLTENITPPTSPSRRSPLSNRRGYTNTPVSGEKGKKEDKGDKGKGQGVRAEQGKSREVPAKRVSNSIHLIGLPSPSHHSLSRRIPNPFPPLARISSQDQLYEDIYEKLGIQHTGDVSDSSVQSGQAGGANYRRGAGLEELDDIGDVSELLGGSEEETILGHQARREEGEEYPRQLLTTASFASIDSKALIRKEDPANHIGQNGHVPRRVNEIATRHKADRQLPITPPAKKQRTGTTAKLSIAPLPIESARLIPGCQHKQEYVDDSEPLQPVDITTSTVLRATNTEILSPSSLGETPASPVTPSGQSIAQLVDMVDSLQSRLAATTLENETLRSENADLRSELANSAAVNAQLTWDIATSTLEREAMETEIAQHSMIRRKNNETILRLEEEKKRLVMERKSAVADLDDLRELMQQTGIPGIIAIGDEWKARRKRRIDEVDEESGDDMANRQTVEMLRQAGMFLTRLSLEHWSNTAQDVASLKRKANSILDTPSKRLRVD